MTARTGTRRHARIRRLGKTDYREVSRIYSEAIREYLNWKEREGKDELAEERRSIARTLPFKSFEFYSEAGGSFVASLNGRAIGFILAQPVQDLDGRILWLDFIAVRPAFRRQGVGLALLSSVRKWGAKQNIGRTFTTLNPNNEASKALLRGAGFEVREWLTANYPPGSW
jgi:RimJ/RimL family protein N-acetyltransferase